MATRQLSDARSDGVVIGQSTSDKVAFYGGTPAAQRANATQAAAGTTAVTSTSPFGFATSTQGDALVALVDEMRTVLVTHNLMKGSA